MLVWSYVLSSVRIKRLKPFPCLSVPRINILFLYYDLMMLFVDTKHTTNTSYFSYWLMQQLPDATPEQIKKAYYNCMKSCHPDLSGNDPGNTNFCMFINEVYAVGFLLENGTYLNLYTQWQISFAFSKVSIAV